MMLAILAGAFLCIVALVVAAGWWISETPKKAETPKAPAETPPLVFDQAADVPGEPALLEFVRTAGQLIPGAAKPDPVVDRLLLAAGYLHPGRQAYFRGVQALTGFGLALLFTLIRGVQGSELAGTLFAAAAGVALGLMIPQRVLRWLGQRRRHHIRIALPPAIDLLVLNLEAGQGLDSSLEAVSRELRRVHPEFARELSLVPLHMRAGNARSAVLEAMAKRIKEPELTRLVQVLSDGDRFGATLAPSLKNHARYLRTRRRQSAQEQARKVSVKLVFPVFFLIFPAVLLVTLGPAVINLRKGLADLMMK